MPPRPIGPRAPVRSASTKRYATYQGMTVSVYSEGTVASYPSPSPKSATASSPFLPSPFTPLPMQAFPRSDNSSSRSSYSSHSCSSDSSHPHSSDSHSQLSRSDPSYQERRNTFGVWTNQTLFSASPESERCGVRPAAAVGSAIKGSCACSICDRQRRRMSDSS